MHPATLPRRPGLPITGGRVVPAARPVAALLRPVRPATPAQAAAPPAAAAAAG